MTSPFPRRRRARRAVVAAAAASLVAGLTIAGISIARSQLGPGASDLEARVAAGPGRSPTTGPGPRPSASARPRAPSPRPVPRPSGCAGDPHGCGYPDATNTGVPANVQLTDVPGQQTSGPGWAWDSDHIVVTGKGTTVSGLNINGWVEVDADNVTLDDLNVTETGDWWGVGLYCQDQPGGNNGCTGTTIENSAIGSPAATGPNRLEVAIKDVYGDASGTLVRKVDIYHASTGIQISNGTIEDSYIHDFGYNAAEGDHLNGISVGGGDPRSLLIQHNTVLDNYDQTDAVALFQDFGPETNKTISDNLLAGGSYALYGGGPNGCTGPATAPKCDPSSDVVVTGNIFSTIFFPTCGTFGPVANFNPAGSGNVWSANTWADGADAGKPVSP
jgi:hypothetical protein